MGLFDFLKPKKEKTDEASAAEADSLMPLDGADLAGIDPPETRYTQEYQDFLASQEAACESETTAGAEYPVVSPEGFCGRFERCSASLIEEPETCDVCIFFCDRDNTCRWPDQAQ